MSILGLVIILCAVLDILYTGIGLLDICLIISGILLLATAKLGIFRSSSDTNKLSVILLIVIVSLVLIFVPLRFTKDKGSLAEENKLLKKSSDLINNGMYAEAEQLLPAEDNRTENMINLSTALLRQEKPEEALEVLKSISNPSCRPEMQNFNYAMCYYQMHEYSLALDHLRKTMVYQPDLMEAYLYAGESSMRLQKYKAAQYYFKTAAELEPSNPAVHYHLGQAYLAVMDFNNAEAEFNQASPSADDPSLQQKIAEGLNETAYYLEQIHE